MRNHRKIKALRSKFGINGYAIWCMFIEFLTAADGNVFEDSQIEYEMLSGDFGVSATEISNLIEYCLQIELLFTENGFIYSESLNERLAPVYTKRGKAKELSKKQQRINGKFTINNTESHGDSVAETPQRKVNESKGNKSKKKESKSESGAACAATIDERRKIFMDNVAKYIPEYGKEMLREFFDYWTESNENGKKMRFEMQKVFDLKRRLKTWSNNEKRRFNGKSGITKVIDQQQRLDALIDAEFAGKGTTPQGG